MIGDNSADSRVVGKGGSAPPLPSNSQPYSCMRAHQVQHFGDDLSAPQQRPSRVDPGQVVLCGRSQGYGANKVLIIACHSAPAISKRCEIPAEHAETCGYHMATSGSPTLGRPLSRPNMPDLSKPLAKKRAARARIRRREHGEETLSEIGRNSNVSGRTISRLMKWTRFFRCSPTPMKEASPRGLRAESDQVVS